MGAAISPAVGSNISSNTAPATFGDGIETVDAALPDDFDGLDDWNGYLDTLQNYAGDQYNPENDYLYQMSDYAVPSNVPYEQMNQSQREAIHKLNMFRRKHSDYLPKEAHNAIDGINQLVQYNGVLTEGEKSNISQAYTDWLKAKNYHTGQKSSILYDFIKDQKDKFPAEDWNKLAKELFPDRVDSNIWSQVKSLIK